MKRLIGISCCSKEFGVYATPNHAASDTYVRAVDEVMGAVPVLIPANGNGADIATLLERLDGIILTGSRSNVEPCHYSGPPHLCGTPQDTKRDAVTLRLVRAAIERRVPLLAICRGFQEMNVALGGTLHQRLQDLPGRIDHSTPLVPDEDVRHAKAHTVTVTPGGWLHRVARCSVIAVNSLHNQGIDSLAPSLVVEAVAADGTIEAFRDRTSYAVGVQWHPEYDFSEDAVSRRIFEDFAAAILHSDLQAAAD